MHLSQKNKHFIFVFIIILFTCSIATSIQAQNLRNKFDSFFCEINKDENINGSVYIAENGNLVYQQSFGNADEEHKIANTTNTLFQIASVSKIFTAVAVLQLYEQKKIKLTDKFVDYFPAFPYANVTIQQILSNTSGIANTGDFLRNYWRMNRDTVFTLDDIIPALKASNTPLDFEPGEGWEYSNTNYNLLALLTEKVSHEAFNNYISNHVFKPAGMESTFLKTPGSNPYHQANVAYNYATPFLFSLPVRVDSFAIPYFKIEYRTIPDFGAAGIYSSVTDLASFHDALNKGKLLKPGSLDLLYSASVKNNGKKIILGGVGSEAGEIGDFYWGFGNRIYLDSSMGKIIWESGGMPGCNANIVYNLNKHQLLIWLNNKESATTMNNIFEALNILNNKPFIVKKAKKHAANIYGNLLLEQGDDKAFASLINMKSDTANYIVDEDELNQLGYDFSENNLNTLALTTFRTAILLFPNSDNLLNSYAEVLLKAGKKEEAIIMYKESLLLNPDNEDSIKALQKLEEK